MPRTARRPARHQTAYDLGYEQGGNGEMPDWVSRDPELHAAYDEGFTARENEATPPSESGEQAPADTEPPDDAPEAPESDTSPPSGRAGEGSQPRPSFLRAGGRGWTANDGAGLLLSLVVLAPALAELHARGGARKWLTAKFFNKVSGS